MPKMLRKNSLLDKQPIKTVFNKALVLTFCVLSANVKAKIIGRAFLDLQFVLCSLLVLINQGINFVQALKRFHSSLSQQVL